MSEGPMTLQYSVEVKAYVQAAETPLEFTMRKQRPAYEFAMRAMSPREKYVGRHLWHSYEASRREELEELLCETPDAELELQSRIRNELSTNPLKYVTDFRPPY